MEPSDQFVNVCQDSRAALSDPTFIIEHGGRYYLTLAVLEYNPGDAKGESQVRGCREITELFNQCKGESFCAVPLPRGPMRTMAATNPSEN